MVILILAKRCPSIPQIDDAIVTININPYPEYNNTFGTHLNYRCKVGWSVIDGTNSKLCSEDGVWVGEDLKCQSESI